MSNRDPDARDEQLPQALAFHSRQWAKANLHTAIPGIIRAYDAPTKRARVQIALNMLLTDGTTKARPILLDVPVIHPSGGGLVCHINLVPGDGVWLIFSERGIQHFKRTYDVADPPKSYHFAETNAVAFPGFGALSITPASTTGLSIQTEDGQTSIVMTPGEITIRAQHLVIQADRVDESAY